MPMTLQVVERISREFGEPARSLKKIKAWNVTSQLGVVVEIDQPKREDIATVWLPYPNEGQAIPEIAHQYPGETGRHSNTYASPGLEKGKPVLKIKISNCRQLEDTIKYVQAMKAATSLPEVKATLEVESYLPSTINTASMPNTKERRQRREALSKAVQREVWQRDGGCCVECSTREKLCFDHIIPLSRGGSNTVRNLQLLCESCNLSKGNRI